MVVAFNDESVVDAVETALAAATHLADVDAGAVAVLRSLARTIDAMSDDTDMSAETRKSLDNVSIPTFLKYCDALGLTPAGRTKFEEDKKPAQGKLAQLKAVQTTRRTRSA